MRIFERALEIASGFGGKGILVISSPHREMVRMKRLRISGLAFCVLGLGLVGCASEQARYVYQDRDSGVIAIPRNTPKMMAQAESADGKALPREEL